LPHVWEIMTPAPMALGWVLGVCVVGKLRKPGHRGWHCDQTDGPERSLCLQDFKLAQKLRLGEEEEDT